MIIALYLYLVATVFSEISQVFNYIKDNDELTCRIDKLARDNARLREAFEKLAKHSYQCAVYSQTENSSCDCGLVEMLSAIAATDSPAPTSDGLNPTPTHLAARFRVYAGTRQPKPKEQP